MGLIGRNCTHSNVVRRPVLIHQNQNTNTNQQNKPAPHRVHSPVSDTPHHPNHHGGPQPRGHARCGQQPKNVSVVDSGGETPGPIPNPEAKPARADGTAPGRVWESRLPPTQQLKKHSSSPAMNITFSPGCWFLSAGTNPAPCPLLEGYRAFHASTCSANQDGLPRWVRWPFCSAINDRCHS